jgi:hypothetical protein
MTYQQTIWTINDAALHAAESAIDAFGSDPNAEFPSAEVVWDFLNHNVYEEGEIERPAALPDVMTRGFKDEYTRHIRNFLEQRAQPSANYPR